MKTIAFFFLLVFGIPVFCKAQNLGSYGHTFEIQEEDLSQVLKNRAQKWVDSPFYEKFKQEAQERVRRRIENPLRGKSLPRTRIGRVYSYDPTLEVKETIYDDKGRIVAPKGKRVNPFDYVQLTKKLIFLDGNDKDQITWLKNFKRKIKEPIKIILVAGPPLKRSQELDIPIYFDQAGYLNHKLGIQQVPCIVSQEGKKLKLEEVEI